MVLSTCTPQIACKLSTGISETLAPQDTEAAGSVSKLRAVWNTKATHASPLLTVKCVGSQGKARCIPMWVSATSGLRSGGDSSTLTVSLQTVGNREEPFMRSKLKRDEYPSSRICLGRREGEPQSLLGLGQDAATAQSSQA